jgi:hypothetical protein
MAESVQFTYTLPGDNEVEVNAAVAPGRPEFAPSLNSPGEPAEEPEIEISECYLRDTNENMGDLIFEPEGLYFRGRNGKFINIVEDMKERAWEAYSAR